MPPDKEPKDRKRPREVQVVKAPSGFPISLHKKKRGALPSDGKKRGIESNTRSKKQERLLDWSETAKEIHAFGAKAFVGKQKRNYEEEQYKLLTGREKKKHQRVPLPIVRGIKKKAAQREARQIQEAKEAGIVMPKRAATATMVAFAFAFDEMESNDKKERSVPLLVSCSEGGRYP